MFSDPVHFIVVSLFLVPGLLLGLVLHEAAHAWVAVARGDQTPRLDGRLSLNPSHHLDPLGTIAILLIRFGWAKPVRINPSRMAHRFDPALVALAGPLTNVLIAVGLSLPLRLLLGGEPAASGCVGPFICAVPLTLLQPPLDSLIAVLLVAFYLNIVLATFNILPIPPLDGYNLVATLLRRRFASAFYWIDSNRSLIMLVLVLLIFLPGLIGQPNVLGIVIAPVYGALSSILLGSIVYPQF